MQGLHHRADQSSGPRAAYLEQEEGGRNETDLKVQEENLNFGNIVRQK